MTLVIGALALAAYVTRPEQTPRPPQFITGIMTAYSTSAVETFEREGTAGLDSFLRHIEQEAHVRARLFDAGGAELTGGDVTPDEKELAARVIKTGDTASKIFGGMALEARAESARSGGRYAFVATLPLGPPIQPGRPGPFPRMPPPGPLGFLLGDTPSALALRLLAVILTAGLLCYLLARYIVSPVVKLRTVTRQVADGDLSARVGPLLGHRRDELADMGRDFDAMAAQVEALMSAQQRLLRDISHELRSPLARLGVALDLLRKRTGPEAEVHLARIERESARLNEMIGQLLSLSRWESGDGRMRRQPVDLAALVREVAEDADFEARGQNRAVETVECEECEAAGTPVLLRSAVENVVRNAVRHTPEGTTVKLSLRVSRAHDGGEAVLSVRDEGPGVPEESLSEIFRPFYRVDDSRTRETGGAGLGLAITERAVRLHGGTVTASNVSGGGFVVEIHLPLWTASLSK
jgi:two-component system sensor histidine kinase CpxA